MGIRSSLQHMADFHFSCYGVFIPCSSISNSIMDCMLIQREFLSYLNKQIICIVILGAMQVIGLWCSSPVLWEHITGVHIIGCLNIDTRLLIIRLTLVFFHLLSDNRLQGHKLMYCHMKSEVMKGKSYLYMAFLIKSIITCNNVILKINNRHRDTLAKCPCQVNLLSPSPRPVIIDLLRI